MNGTEQRAQLYFGAKATIAFPTHRTDAGFYLSGSPFVSIGVVAPANIGASVAKALSAYQHSIRTPTRDDYPVLARFRLEAACVRSEAAFMRSARLLNIVRTEWIVITPHRNGGASGSERGFHALTGKARTISLSSTEIELGEACLSALEACE